MSLYLVEPKDAKADACRKLYVDGSKTKSSFATWNVIHGEEAGVTPQTLSKLYITFGITIYPSISLNLPLTTSLDYKKGFVKKVSL